MSLAEAKWLNHQSHAIGLVVDVVVAGGSNVYVPSPRTLDP